MLYVLHNSSTKLKENIILNRLFKKITSPLIGAHSYIVNQRLQNGTVPCMIFKNMNC